MCGITGIYNPNVDYRINQSTLKNMCQVIEHRGTEERGIYYNNNMYTVHKGSVNSNTNTANLAAKYSIILQSLQNNSDFIQTPETASKAIAVIDAIFKSIKNNTPVKL